MVTYTVFSFTFFYFLQYFTKPPRDSRGNFTSLVLPRCTKTWHQQLLCDCMFSHGKVFSIPWVWSDRNIPWQRQLEKNICRELINAYTKQKNRTIFKDESRIFKQTSTGHTVFKFFRLCLNIYLDLQVWMSVVWKRSIYWGLVSLHQMDIVYLSSCSYISEPCCSCLTLNHL